MLRVLVAFSQEQELELSLIFSVFLGCRRCFTNKHDVITQQEVLIVLLLQVLIVELLTSALADFACLLNSTTVNYFLSQYLFPL